VLVEAVIAMSRVGFVEEAGRRVGTLDVRTYCGDSNEKPIGEAVVTVDLALTEANYRKYTRSGIPFTTRVPVIGQPKWVKMIVYDAATDLAGSAALRLR
jgi:hypothetical protein